MISCARCDRNLSFRTERLLFKIKLSPPWKGEQKNLRPRRPHVDGMLHEDLPTPVDSHQSDGNPHAPPRVVE